MGAGNVGLVYARWGHLPHVPFRVLAYMALRTLDDDDPPLFWGGRDSLAAALGRIVPKPEDDAAKRERRAAFQAVKEAVTTLRKYGAAELVEDARPGRNAVYALNLHRRMVVAEPTPSSDGPVLPPEGLMVVAEPTPVVVVGPTPVGEAEPVIGVGSATPRGEVGGSTSNKGGGRADLRNARYHSARAREDDDEISPPTPPTPTDEPPRPTRVPIRIDGPTCPCGALLDPDGSCFVCRR
jgi:hypothetical protein